MSSQKKNSFELSFERALRAAIGVPTPGKTKSPKSRPKDQKSLADAQAQLAGVQKGQAARRFIGKSQIDIKHSGVRRMPTGPAVPWYVVVIAVGKIRHKFSLGAPARWKADYDHEMDDNLIDHLAQAAVCFALNEEDDTVPDVVNDVVAQATDGHRLPDGSYTVRKSI